MQVPSPYHGPDMGPAICVYICATLRTVQLNAPTLSLKQTTNTF